jgi:probable rRNA maturation factor
MKSDPLITYRRKPATLDLDALEAFAEVLRKRVAKGREFHCRVTNDEELQTLNRQYSRKDYATDVLSFPDETGSGYLGDIAISLQRARAQAKDFGHSVEEELSILLLHGVLHVTGLDHETDGGVMAQAERRWRRKLGLSTSLTERAEP